MKVVIESIQKVTEMEQNAKKQRESAVAANKQELLDAQRAVRQLVEQARQEAEGQVQGMMTAAEEDAAKWTRSVLEEARKDCDKLKSAARGRLKEAVEFLTEKVVNQ